MNPVEKREFILWLDTLNKRMDAQLKFDDKDYSEDWTEEVIVPEEIYNFLPDIEKYNWNICDLQDIYCKQDILEIFGVQPSKLNKCFSKRFYKLTTNELDNWNRFGKMINNNLPINEILVIYSQ
tara:strand:- start:252 stop:623 length:372 start_codon:yes stop_codon:yes gene_type:complete